MELVIDPKESTCFGLNLRCSKDKAEKTVIMYDCEKQLISFNREHSGKGDKGIRQAEVKLINQDLKLYVFIDRSSVEVFINDGQKVMTARIFPENDSKGIRFFPMIPSY